MKRMAAIIGFLDVFGCAHMDIGFGPARSDWTGTDTALVFMSVAASALDAYTTEAGDFDHYIHPLMDDGNICAVIGITELAVIGVSMFLPKKLRRPLLLMNATGRVGFSLHNLSTTERFP
jgi:hypothetical protein